MTQIIEVRLINPNPGNVEVLADEFTKANSHQEAIELALNAWSGGGGVLKSVEVYTPGEFVGGGIPCWKYVYQCILEDPDDPEQGRVLLAVLFAQYKERERE